MTTSPAYVRRNEFVMVEMEEGLVVLMIETGKYFQINRSTGRIIWQALEKPCSVDEIVELLLLRFQVSKDICHDETRRFVGELEKAGMVQQLNV